MARVEFYAGTTLLNADTTAPYAFTWSNVSAGSYSVTAQAVDNLGTRTTSAPVSITVAMRVTGVSVSPSSVMTGQSATVTVSGSSGCGGVQIHYGDGFAPVYPISALPFSQSHTWTTGGIKTIVATGHGNCSGQVSTTLGVTANAAPLVSLTSPASGIIYAMPATVPLAASASDPDGSVARVEFYAGTTLLNADTTAPYAFTWSNVSAGSYSVTAQAVDNLGTPTRPRRFRSPSRCG